MKIVLVQLKLISEGGIHMEDRDIVLQVKNLKKYFPIKEGFFTRKPIYLKAVDGVSFEIKKGETFGLVGESGCGKTTTGRTIIKLYEPTDGEVIFNNQTLSKMNMRNIRKDMQMIFQDPYGCLNPRMTVSEILAEPLEIYKVSSGIEKQNMVYDALAKVGLSKKFANRYPHEFSGGQRQRVGIARALMLSPKLIVCDEPISALDVSVQGQIVNMLQDLQVDLGLTYLFIAHDLAMVKYISDRIGVMYLGKIVEISESHDLYDNPIHPYTQALLSSIPIADPDASAKMERIVLQGSVPSPISSPSGCRFRTRCKYAKSICEEVEPELKEVSEGHKVACHLVNEDSEI